MTIRQATKKDQDTLTHLARKTINHSYRVFLGDEAVDEFINSGASDQEIIDNLNHITILEQDNDIIGLAIWHDNLLHLLMVDPDHHGSGVSTAFVNEMIGLKLESFDEVVLETFDQNERAKAFYEKTGWELYKTEAEEGTDWQRLHYRIVK